MNDFTQLALFEKLGCTLEVKMDNRGRGYVVTKVYFLEDDKESALQVTNTLIEAALRRMGGSEHYEEDGEIPLGDGEVEEDDVEFGIRRERNRR